MKTIAIIQARLGSTRLPYKMMLHGKPIIEWVIKRVQNSNDIIVAILKIMMYWQNISLNLKSKYLEEVKVMY